MEALILALEVRKRYNKMSLENFIKEFEVYTQQEIPEEIIDEFKLTGLCNTDFLNNCTWVKTQAHKHRQRE